MKKLFYFLNIWFMAITAFCQIDESHLKDIEYYIENQEQTIDYTDLLEQLQYHLQHPANLNTSGAEELLALRVFNPMQVQAILQHRQAFGNFKSVLELQTIDELDLSLLNTILPYLTVQSSLPSFTDFKGYIKKANHSATAVFSSNSPVSEGYKTLPPDSVSAYLGTPYSVRTKYIMSYNSVFYAGFNLEKDEGELWHRKGQLGLMDFQSLHVFARFKGKIKTIALGDYQIGWGQGLTFSGSFGTGLSAQVLNVKHHGLQLRPYRSFNESQFLRGGAINFMHRKLECTLFYSNKKMDVNMEILDQTQAGNAERIGRSILMSGLHRTQNELLDRKTGKQNIVGIYTSYSSKKLNIGYGAMYNAFNFLYAPNLRIDNSKSFRGTSFYKMGLDFSTLIKRTQVFGEFTVCSNKCLGLILGGINSPTAFLDFVALYRHYSPGFIAMNASAFSSGSEASNENGTYIGFVIRPNKRVNFSGYLDQSQNQWYQFNADGIAPKRYLLADFRYQTSKTSVFYIRYKSTIKTTNAGFETYNHLQTTEKYNLRIQVEQKFSAATTFKARYEISNFNGIGEAVKGSLLFLDCAYKMPGLPISYQMRLCWFSCADFNSRIYSTESNILYQWSVPAFYGEGFKYYFLSKIKVGKRLAAQGRVAFTKYLDKTETGSGNDKVLSNRIWEINVLLSYVFK